MLPDNRIQLPSAKIDFATQVGLTGQDHDNYPPEGGVARFDHMRMFLIGLLANQSSINPPTQYRPGTLWFDLNDNTLKVYDGSAWVGLANAIQLDSNNDLQQWYDDNSAVINQMKVLSMFRGRCSSINATSIPIPATIQTNVDSDTRALVFVNGQLRDPMTNTILGSPPNVIQLGKQLVQNDTFVVLLISIPSSNFVVPEVIV